MRFNDDICRLISRLSRRSGSKMTALESILIEEDSSAYKLISDFSETLDDEDIAKYAPCIHDTLIFSFLSDDKKRVASLAIVEAAEYKSELDFWLKYMKKYDYEKDKIFKEHPKLLKHKHKKDLVNYRVLNRMHQSYVCNYNKKWLVLNSNIPAKVLEWCDKCFVDSPVYARLNPDRCTINKPSGKVYEALTYNTDNTWWQNLNVFYGHGKGVVAEISEDDIKSNPIALKDYGKGYRRIEMSCSRDAKGNLSMLIEELQIIHNHVDESDFYIVGRIIHLDTDAQEGTSFDNAVMNHIDLAINIYVGDDAYQRYDEKLPLDGKTVDASTRSHLIKIFKLPFKYMLKLAKEFFKSEFLFNEFVTSQFGKI